jgi:hypothetical protein
MANVNLSREDKFCQKKSVSVFTAVLDFTDNIPTSADVYQLFTLPPMSIVTVASALVLVASDAATTATADVGFAGGDTLIDGANLKSAAGTSLSGGTNAKVAQLSETGGVVTFVPTYTGAVTAGKFLVRIEYVETEKVNGEYTNFVN